jgi:hypothetical protein
MDYQTFVNWGAGTLLAIVSWAAKELWSTLKGLQSSFASFREEVAREYVTRVDFKESLRDLKELLEKIDVKLDRKADKE